mgnify:CR=1 FL=1|jgi:hypothetical protein
MPGVTIFPLNDIPFLSLFFNFYGYYLPIFLYATWTPLALIDLSEKKYASNLYRVSWTLLIMLVPLVGSLMYHLFIADSVNTTVRATMVFGGIITLAGVLIYLGTAL